MSETSPRYRLRKGRPLGVTAPPTRLVHISFPLDLFQQIHDDLRDDDVSRELSNLVGGAYLADYVRAACLVFSSLLQGPTRARVLAFANLPEDKLAYFISHLTFHHSPQTELETAKEEGRGEPLPGQASISERDPWNQL